MRQNRRNWRVMRSMIMRRRSTHGRARKGVIRTAQGRVRRNDRVLSELAEKFGVGGEFWCEFWCEV